MVGSDDENSLESGKSTLIPSTYASNTSTDTLTPSIAPSIIIAVPKVKDIPCPRTTLRSSTLTPGGECKPSFTKRHPFWTVFLYLLAILVVGGWMVCALVLIVIGLQSRNGAELKIGFGVGMICVGFVPTMGLYGNFECEVGGAGC